MYKVVVCFRMEYKCTMVVVCFRGWSINVQGGCMFQVMEYKCTRWLHVSDDGV